MWKHLFDKPEIMTSPLHPKRSIWRLDLTESLYRPSRVLVLSRLMGVPRNQTMELIVWLADGLLGNLFTLQDTDPQSPGRALIQQVLDDCEVDGMPYTPELRKVYAQLVLNAAQSLVEQAPPHTRSLHYSHCSQGPTLWLFLNQETP